jgi:hypothetical protein
MKKALKALLYVVLGIVFIYVAVVLLSQYVFTKDINLSCKGVWTTQKILNGKVLSQDKSLGTESVVISITEYPFSNPHVIISNNLNLLMPGKSTNQSQKVLHIDKEQIFGGEKNYYEDSRFSMYGLRFNRLTRVIEIEKQSGNEKSGQSVANTFNSTCDVVKPL